MTRKSTRALAVLLVLLVSSGPALSQAPPTPYEIYRDVLAAYVRGDDMEKAVLPLGRLSSQHFDAAIRHIIGRHNRTEMEAAAVLQLEFGLAVVAFSPASADQHFGFGEKLISTLSSIWPKPPLPPDLRDFIANWYAVFGSAYLTINDHKRARYQIRRALGVLRQPEPRRSAPLLTLLGEADELEAAIISLNAWPDGGVRTRIAMDVRRRLLVADDLYQQAIADDPGYVRAHLRRGHVLLQVGNLKQARAVMDHALSLAQEPLHKYLGNLTLGAILQEQDDHTAARAAYERALAIVPGSQTASVALSYLDVLTGRPDLAQARARAFVASPSDDRSWWEYRHGGVYHAGLEWLQKQVQR